MADRFYVGGTGNYTDTAHWSTTSGGIGGASEPTASDRAVFDANSGTGTCTVNGASARSCGELAAGTSSVGITLAQSFNIGGSTLGAFALNASMAWGNGSGFTVGFITSSTNGGAGFNVTSGGKAIGPTNFAAGGRWKFTDAQTFTTWAHSLGTIDTNNQSVTATAYTASGASAKTLTPGSSTITLTVSNAGAFTASSSTPTITANTATFALTGASGMAGGGVNFNGASITHTGGSSTSFGFFGAGAWTGITNLTITGTASKAVEYTLGGTLTITGNLSLTSNSTINRAIIRSSALGTSRTVTVGGAVSVTNGFDFQDIAGAGAASWNLSAVSGGSGDAGGNSGITFTTAATQYWVGNTGSVSNVNKWASSSGGAAGSGRIPLPQDPAVWDTNSVPAGGQTVTFDMVRMGPVDMSGVDAAGAISFNVVHSVAVTFYGSLALSTKITPSTGWSSGGLAVQYRGRGTNTIKSAGVAMNTVGGHTVAAASGTYTLVDAFSCNTGTLTLTSGTFSSGDQSILVSRIDSQSGIVRTAGFGTSTVSLSGAAGAAVLSINDSNLTWNASAATFAITGSGTKTFDGGSKTFGTITWSATAATVTFQRNMTVGTFTVTGGGKTVTFTIGTTATLTTALNIVGTSGASLITVNSSSAGTSAGLVAGAGVAVNVQYASIKDSAASGGADFKAVDSTDVSGNTGWRFNTTIGDEVSTPWSTRTAVGDTNDLRWAVRNTVADTVNTPWAVRSTAGDVVDERWRTAALGGDQADVRWADRATTADALDARWGVRVLGGDETSLPWSVRARAGDAEVLEWDVRELAGDSLSAPWSVRQVVGDESNSYWGVRVLGSDDVSLPWSIRGRAGDDVTAEWDLRDLVRDDLSTPWNVRGRVGDAADYQWGVRVLGGDSADLRWSARTLVNEDLALQWALTEHVARSVALAWSVRHLAAGDVGFLWTVVKVATLALVVELQSDDLVVGLASPALAVEV